MIWLITTWIACDYFSWNRFNVCMTSILLLLMAPASPKPNRKTESLPSEVDLLIFAKENKENIIIGNYWIRLSMIYSDRGAFFPKTPDRRLHLQRLINFAKMFPSSSNDYFRFSYWLIKWISYRAVFTWLSKGIGFGFGFGFTTPFGWLVYLLWFWFYDSQVKTALKPMSIS